MASVPIRLGLKQVAQQTNNGIAATVILSKKSPPLHLRIGVASIHSKTWRIQEDRWPKPKPWPYREKGFSNLHAFLDGTIKRFDENTKVITVEGPPAIGKSVFARSLAEELDMKYFPMPTTDYEYINSYGFDSRTLDDQLPPGAQSMDENKFIKNPHHPYAPKYPFSLFRIKYAQYIDALSHLFNTGEGVVIERSFWTDVAFIEALAKVGYLNKEELAGYHKMRTNVVTEGEHSPLEDPVRPHLAIYLDASVDTVLKNLEKRGKGEEKVYHREFLSHLENYYKRSAMVELEKHAEVLVYDWNEPGDSEVVVEDIERIDFDRFGVHDTKMEDWRFKDDMDYSEARWQYTMGNNKVYLLKSCDVLLLDCPRLMTSGQEYEDFEKVYYSSPGNKYIPGFNPDQGDKVWWKFQKKINFLQDNVTEMLLNQIPKPAGA